MARRLYLTSILFISPVWGLLPQLLSGIQQKTTQCFFNGRWYPPGAILNAGRSGDWCFGAYCDFDGMIKFWDDYNCPQTNGNSPPFPDISVLLKSAGINTQNTTAAPPTTTTATTTPAPVVTPRPTLFPYPVTTPAPKQHKPLFLYIPTTTQATFKPMGCFAQGRVFWPGEDITNVRRGRRCFGSYCDFNSVIQHWEDVCPVTPRYTPTTVDYT